MAERQLAELLVGIGLDRNVDIEHIASDLVTIKLPGYVDAAAFQSALLEAVESQLYRQTDERIRALREQLAAGAGAARVAASNTAASDQPSGQPEPAQSESRSPDEPASPTQPAPESTPYEEPDATMVESEEIPEDATMIWKTRDQGF